MSQFLYVEAKISAQLETRMLYWEKRIGMQRSCPIFLRLFMHNTLTIMLDDYIFIKGMH